MTRRPEAAPVSPLGRFAAYGALALTLLGLPLIAVSESDCRFDPETNDQVGVVTEPGGTGGPLAFLLAPLVSLVAVIALYRAGRRRGRVPRLPMIAALAVFPLALVNFLLYAVKGAFACGFF